MGNMETGEVAQGQKRSAEDELNGEQRLTKRFHLLNLENARQLYIPIQQRSPTRRQRSNAVSDSMHVEDSKHHIYIQDLDEELAGTGSDEERLIFLPDIEKKLASLPKSLLATETAPRGNEVVLYSVPESLSVPKHQDNVRKAIIESRARARETQLLRPQNEREADSLGSRLSSCNSSHHTHINHMHNGIADEDCMDIG